MVRDRNGRPSLCPLLSLTPPYVPYVPFSVPVERVGAESWPFLSGSHQLPLCCTPSSLLTTWWEGAWAVGLDGVLWAVGCGL